MRSTSARCAAAAVSMLLFGAASGAPAFAQPAAAPAPAPGTTPSTKTAQQYYDEGVKAADQNQWEKARVAFLEAWRLKPNAQTAANLGRAEFNVGKFRDAADDLAYFLRGTTEVQGIDRRKLQDMFDKARAKVGELRISVSAAGAEVLVDGAAMGKAPLADQVFVEPGARVVEARLEGVGAAKETATVTAGGKVDVSLTLGKAPVEVKGSAGAAGGSAGLSAGTAPPAKPAAGAGAGGTGAPAAARGATGTTRPNLGIIIGGGAGAGALLIAGIAFTAVANGKASKGREEAGQLTGTCPLPPPSTGPCADIATLFRQRASFSNAAVWSFIGAGALGAATVIYVVATRSAPKAAVRAAPIVTASGGGLTVEGAW